MFTGPKSSNTVPCRSEYINEYPRKVVIQAMNWKCSLNVQTSSCFENSPLISYPKIHKIPQNYLWSLWSLYNQTVYTIYTHIKLKLLTELKRKEWKPYHRKNTILQKGPLCCLSTSFRYDKCFTMFFYLIVWLAKGTGSYEKCGSCLRAHLKP